MAPNSRRLLDKSVGLSDMGLCDMGPSDMGLSDMGLSDMGLSDMGRSGGGEAAGRPRVGRLLWVTPTSVCGRVLPVVIGLMGLLAMPTLQPYVGTGTDPSWSIALNMATARHLRFGKDVVFTFGPLGFLASPGLSIPKLGLVAMLARFGFSFLLGWLVSRSLLRIVWWPVVAALAWFLQWAIVGGSSGGAETVLLPVLLLIFGLLDALAIRRLPVPWWVLAGCGCVISTAALTKFDTGILCVLVAAGFVTAEGFLLRRRMASVARSAGVVGVSSAVSLVVWWVVLGQRLGDVGAWAASSWQVFRGYESAMVADSPLSVSPRHSVIAVAIVVALTLLCAVMAVDRRTSLVIWVLSMCAFAAYAKQSFTRYDDGHLQRLYVSGALTLITGAGAMGRRRVPTVRTFGIAGAIVGAFVFGRIGADLVHAPKADTMSWRKVAKLVLSPEKREAIVTRQRSLLPAELDMPPEVRAALAGATVHIEPTETSVAWVFPELKWKPLPVFQSYSAYTPELDNLNAASLKSPTGPGIVLFRGGLRVDLRMARFESPASQFAFICNFRPKVLTSDGWQVFERRPDGTACAIEPTPIETTVISARLGHRVELPTLPDDAIVVASFRGLDRSLASRVRDTILRAPKYWFVLTRPDPGEPAHRYVAANAKQPHVISVPRCLRGNRGTYDTRTFSGFDLRRTEWPGGTPPTQQPDTNSGVNPDINRAVNSGTDPGTNSGTNSGTNPRPNSDAPGTAVSDAGTPYTVTLTAYRYKCPADSA